MFPGFFIGTMFLFSARPGGRRRASVSLPSLRRVAPPTMAVWAWESLWSDFAEDDFGWGHRPRRGFHLGGGYERAHLGGPRRNDA